MKCTSLVVALFALASLGISSGRVAPAAAAAHATLSVGQHVEAYTYTRDGSGKNAWRKGVVTEVFAWGAHVRMDDDGEIMTVGNWNLRGNGGGAVAAGAPPPQPQQHHHVADVHPAAAAPQRGGGGGVALGAYTCVAATTGMAIGGQSRMTFPGGSTYIDHLGVRGSYAYSAGRITFRGGEKDGVTASYDPGPPRPVIHILAPSGRSAFDCEHA